MLSNAKQEEIKEVINCLKKFRPTKVALEAVERIEGELNHVYHAYLNEKHSLGINEIEQIGYRMAKEYNLGQVHAVDWNGDQEDIPDLSDLGESEETEHFKTAMQIGQEITSEMEKYLKNHTYRELLLWLNDPEQIAEGHEIYMKMALTGSNEHPVGALWTAKYWYFRNMLIYKNLVNLIDSDEERIFVLYGAGHLHLLLQFLKESNLFEVEVVEDYLEKSGGIGK